MFLFELPQPRLKTKRLLLRELRTEDLDQFMPFAMKDGKYLNREEAIEKINNVQENYLNKICINFGIEYNDVLVGNCGFYRGFKNKIGEIGYVMHPEYRRMGIMKEALDRIIRFGYEELELEKIEAYTKINNDASVSLLYKLGFEKNVNKFDDYTQFTHLRNV